MKIKLYLLLPVFMLLGGCFSIDPYNIQAVMEGTKYSYDEHEGTGIWKAPSAMFYPAMGGLFGNIYDYYFLRGYGANGWNQLYVTFWERDLVFYNKAYSKGKRLDVTKIDVSVNVGWISEDIAINFTQDELEKLANEELFVVKIVGSKGSRVLEIPGTYFRGFLRAMEKGEKKR